jgi:predicted transcriptional regulator
MNMMILYMDESENKFVDFETLKRVLNMKKTTLYRALKKLDEKPIRYKNQFLYNEAVVYLIMKNKLIMKIENELQKDKIVRR